MAIRREVLSGEEALAWPLVFAGPQLGSVAVQVGVGAPEA